MDDKEQMKVLASVTLVRHMMAGSTELKVWHSSLAVMFPSPCQSVLLRVTQISAKMHNIHILMLAVLNKVGSVNELLLLETLHCLRNFMVGWEGGKRVVLGDSKFGMEKREKIGGRSIATTVLDITHGKNVSEGVFLMGMEILKMVCAVECGKIWIIKVKGMFCLVDPGAL